MFPSRSGTLVEAKSIASTSLKHRQSISLASFLQCPHCKKSSLRLATLLKKRLWHRFFPVNFAKFLRTPFFSEHLQWLLLALAPIKISYSNTVCNTSAAKAYVSFLSMVENGRAKDFNFTCIFLRIVTFVNVSSYF